MLAGDWYVSHDPESWEQAKRAVRLQAAYAAAYVADPDAARPILEDLLGHLGAEAHIRPPLYVDYGTSGNCEGCSGPLRRASFSRRRTACPQAVIDRMARRLTVVARPSIRSAWIRFVREVPADHEAVTPGHQRGRASEERAPSSRSRPDSRSTRRTRRTARTWRTQADGSGTGMSGRSSRRWHISADRHRGPSPRSRP
ncbi:maltose acetyltransferase domain-containing protein [Actinacidiphila acididurans]|uniref:maltose acetyltransferase domain-containing protein n=1 Tax=Actinacidiphila acididurans TaxID=2784346 RepID=UPI001F341BE5